MIKRVRLLWYRLRSRFAHQNAFVRCETCPHWIFHSHVKQALAPFDGSGIKTGLDYRAGVCALDRPKVLNVMETNFVFKVWIASDWCARHPLYEPFIVQGSSLQYRPGDDTLANAGFDRLPTFREAVALAMKSTTMSQDTLKDAPEDGTQNDNRAR